MNSKLFKNFVACAGAVTLAGFAAFPVHAESKKGDDSRIQISERQLKDLSEAVHNARHATALLVTECSRENDVVENGEIDFIGTDIIPIIPATSEGYAPSWMPPRGKYLHLHMQTLATSIPLLADEIASLRAPDADEQKKIEPFTSEMNTLMVDVQKHYKNLQPLTGDPPYNRDGIVKEATDMNKDLEEIEKMKKDMYKSYKKDPDKGTGAQVEP